MSSHYVVDLKLIYCVPTVIGWEGSSINQKCCIKRTFLYPVTFKQDKW